MTKDNVYSHDFKSNCLTADDIFLFITGKGDRERLDVFETHMAECAECRRALADVLEILPAHSDLSIDNIPDLSNAELEETITLIRGVARKERAPRMTAFRRFQWPVAAMLVLGLASWAFWGLKGYGDRGKAEAFYAQAKGILEQRYAGRSPGNLRLDMPFSPAPMVRNAEAGDPLRESENLFYQALAIREDYTEARMGIAYIYLNEAKFKRARELFQEVLDSQSSNVPALIGRGVAQYEEALHINDPVQYREMLAGALDDFNEALKYNPDSIEARYNLAWVLFESGSHKEALEEIDRYLSRDAESGWAEELKELKVRIEANNPERLKDGIEKAARIRNRSHLEALARNAPSQMPKVIWATIRKSLALEGNTAVSEKPGAEDLRWAAGILASGYEKATGDRSCGGLLDYYGGLSPPQRMQKKTLDAAFEDLKSQLNQKSYDTILHRSESLQHKFLALRDYWQLYNLHFLRQHCFYMKGDFVSAYDESSKTLDIARRLDSPFLIANSLASLAVSTSQQGMFSESMRFTGELKEIVEEYRLDLWLSYTEVLYGYQYRRLGQYDQSLQKFTSALKISYRNYNEEKILEALENIGDVMNHTGRLQEANAFYGSAVQRLGNPGSGENEEKDQNIELRRLNLIYKQGELSLRMGNPDEAIAYFETSLQSITSGMRELEARNQVGLADAYLEKKAYREAGALLDKIMPVVASGDYPEIAWEAWFLRGRLLENIGDSRGAAASHQKAIDIVEGIRRNIDSTTLRHTFLSDRFDPYKRIIDLLYSGNEDKQSALAYVNRAKSMTLREYLDLPDPAAVPNPDTESAADRGNSFRVLEYFFSADSLLIFVTDAEGRILATASCRLSSADIERNVQEFLESIRNNDIGGFEKLSHLLYNELIAPVELYALDGYSGPVVILPDGPLHFLPFAGLRDGRESFLIQKNPVVYAPSRSVFNHCLSSGREMPVDRKLDVVLIDGSANLPKAREELIYLRQLYGSSARVMGAEDRSEFRQIVAGSDIIHFSGHAEIKDGQPVLKLQQYPQEVYLGSQEIGSWNLPRCRLVNLAGCSTGIGPIAEGESPLGLIPAFLNAGTPAIIASLMPVDDESTKFLTRRLYELLRQGGDNATALQKAQLAMLDQSSGNGKPLTWIPYILIGNPL